MVHGRQRSKAHHQPHRGVHSRSSRVRAGGHTQPQMRRTNVHPRRQLRLHHGRNRLGNWAFPEDMLTHEHRTRQVVVQGSPWQRPSTETTTRMGYRTHAPSPRDTQSSEPPQHLFLLVVPRDPSPGGAEHALQVTGEEQRRPGVVRHSKQRSRQSFRRGKARRHRGRGVSNRRRKSRVCARGQH